MKKLLLLLIPTVALAAHHHTKSFRASALGDYLVNQDGERVVIQGHPHMVCDVGENEQIHGYYEKVIITDPGVVLCMKGWSSMGYKESGKKTILSFAIPKFVCDLK